MNITRKLIIGSVAALAFGGVGTGVATAQTPRNPFTTTATGASPTAPTSPDTDQVQHGDQHGNDQANDQRDATDELDGKSDHADSPGDTEGNHHDADGANVDHTPAGEKPEAGPSGNES